ncbi:MAG TPA: ATP-dependent helicase, partial [Jiangellales bacterium]|nr:ATP-dependent helicase [Jiangellales bacterium]
MLQRPGDPAFRLVRRSSGAPAAPVLDEAQQRVVDHRGGPLLVLAGPGTGKTTALVEHVVSRVEDDGVDPSTVLMLTFSRRAAAEMRERVTARLGRTLREPLARTIHSYAFGLLRRESAQAGEPPPRLLSGAEQDLLIRDLLRGDVEEFGAAGWPERLRPALLTRGFAGELRDLLQRAAERGIDPGALRGMGERLGRDDWVAAAGFAEQYAAVTALRRPPALDPAELVRAAVDLLAADAGLLEQEQGSRAVVVVDEYQDSDPSQEALLRLLAGGGRELVVVGDPDQSIYAFRGAEVEGLHRFPERFRTAAGEPAPVVALSTARRSGPALLAATRRVAAGLGGAGRHRELVAAPPAGTGDGELEVRVLRGVSQEAASVAQVLRSAHLLEGVPWSRMAVVVRGARPLPVLRRALHSAGVPVAVRLEEVPLVEQPPVRALLSVLAVAAGRRDLDADLVTDLVCGPLGGADPLALRRLRQELRRHELSLGGSRSSAELLVEAVRSPAELVLLDDAAVAPLARTADLVAVAEAAAGRTGATAEDVLWAVWQRSGLAARWSRRAVRGGPEGAAADRDLDAVVALFEAAARFVDRLPAAGLDGFLDHLAGQQVPADTLAPRAPEGDAVTLLTAHAAKGLEWDVVVVAGVQEGVWPDLRPRGSLLGSEELVDVVAGRDAVPGARLSALLAEERRLFYVAATRARRRLVVTAVVSEEEEPSRFLDEIDPVVDGERPLLPVRRGLDLPGLVAELRRGVVDATSAPDRRADAARHLARLAGAGVPGAAPGHWYALLPLSD